MTKEADAMIHDWSQDEPPKSLAERRIVWNAAAGTPTEKYRSPAAMNLFVS